MTCAGAIAMEEGLPDSSSAFADEGTAAHFLAAQSLTNDVHPATFLDRTILVGTHPESSFEGAVWGLNKGEVEIALGFEVRAQFKVDMEMTGHVNTYVQHINRFAVGGQLLVEQQIPIGNVTGEDGATGTADAVIVQGDELQIHDLKYGMGVRVEAEENKQLMLYALGALDEYSLLGDFTQVRLFIHQPRVHHAPSEWVVGVEALREFGEQVATRTKVACLAYDHRANWLPGGRSPATQYLTPSDKGCKWCRAKADCPALAAFVTDAVGAEFEDLTKTPVKVEEALSLQVKGDPAILAAKMSACNLIEDWIKAVRGKVESELLAGRDVPGYKLVQGRKGPRAWSDADEAETTLKSMRLKQEEMYDFSLISPTSAEKLFGEKGSQPSAKRWNKLVKLVTQSEGKPSVAPMSDKRPALVIKPAVEEFDNLDDGSDLA